MTDVGDGIMVQVGSGETNDQTGEIDPLEGAEVSLPNILCTISPPRMARIERRVSLSYITVRFSSHGKRL